jgi:hypothetical protein
MKTKSCSLRRKRKIKVGAESSLPKANHYRVWVDIRNNKKEKANE